MLARPRLQVAYLRSDQVLGYRLLGRGDSLSVGAGKGTDFKTPQLSGFPLRFRLLTPVRDGFRLRLGPGLTGELSLRGQVRTVTDVLSTPAVRGFMRDPGMFREAELYPGDTATLILDEDRDLRLQISFTEAPDVVGRPDTRDPMFLKILLGTVAGLGAFVAGMLTIAYVLHVLPPPPELLITPERLAKMVPLIENKKVKEALASSKAAADEAERKRREA